MVVVLGKLHGLSIYSALVCLQHIWELQHLAGLACAASSSLQQHVGHQRCGILPPTVGLA